MKRLLKLPEIEKEGDGSRFLTVGHRKFTLFKVPSHKTSEEIKTN